MVRSSIGRMWVLGRRSETEIETGVRGRDGGMGCPCVVM